MELRDEPALAGLLAEAERDPNIRGLVVTGSAARGLRTEHSDVDVYVVLDEEDRSTTKTPELDSVVWTMAELRELPAPPVDDEGWWSRYSFADARVLLDRTDGELPDLVRAWATLSEDEVSACLDGYLDGYVNFAYRSLKSDREGKAFERRADAVESISWLLWTVFALHGRVRPYNKYLPWELRTHPLDGWPADDLLGLVERTLEGDVDAIRETFARVRSACASYDASRGHTRTSDMVAGWGDELRLFEAPAG